MLLSFKIITFILVFYDVTTYKTKKKVPYYGSKLEFTINFIANIIYSFF